LVWYYDAMSIFHIPARLFPSETASNFLRSHISSAVFATSIAFLALALTVDMYRPHFAPVVFRILIPVLVFAILFALSVLWSVRSDHRGADQAFRNTDCEYESIFHNVLDAILIVDDEGRCLDANPAAKAILRVPLDELIGDEVARFFPECEDFREGWRSFVQTGSTRAQTALTAGDGTTLFVDIAVTPNYLPARHVVILCDVTERTKAESALRESEQRFRHMADNIQEVFWMMDATSKEITYVNPAYATITGYEVRTLSENPSSYRDLIHPEDRIRILSRLHDLEHSGDLDEEFRFTRASGEVRWAWARGICVPGPLGKPWLVGTAQDITSRKQAEIKISEQLDAVDAARTEAEALRKATLALSRNLAMDAVLDTLLHCISELIPFDRATVMFVESGELMVAREAPRSLSRRIGLTLNPSENTFLQRILFEKQSVLLPNTKQDSDWREILPLDAIQSWMGVPLVAGGLVLGILSLAANKPGTFTNEHLRLAKSLAVPASVAIQNARIHERAEIYAAELELRLAELKAAQQALQNASKDSSRNASTH
jgi:PAS domain S-box-containing protein